MWKDHVSSTAEEFTLRLKAGKVSTLKLSQLSEASRKRAAELAKN